MQNKQKILIYLACILLFSTVGQALAEGQAWEDDFEGYPLGSFPSPPWYRSGNTGGAYIDDSVSLSGSQSMHLYGIIGACWGVMVLREITAAPPFTIEFVVYNGSENTYGCHPERGALELKTGTNWWDCGRYLMDFKNDGRIRLHDSIGWSYNELEWVKVRVDYSRPTETTVHLVFWVNDELLYEVDAPSISCEDNLAYIALGAQEGTVWFDDVCIKETPSTAPLDVWQDGNGHLWVENAFYRWDVTHGSSLIIKEGGTWRDWRSVYNQNYYLVLGRNTPGTGGTQGGTLQMSDLTVVSINNDGQVATVVLTGTFSRENRQATLVFTFSRNSGIVKLQGQITNVPTTPNPSGLHTSFSLVPGGDVTGTDDFYHYSGQASESGFPYGTGVHIPRTSFLPVGQTDYAYITNYDKSHCQGFAIITELSKTTDFITDINYGIAQIWDTHHYLNWSNMCISPNVTVPFTLFFYFYETDPVVAYQPVEDLINSGTLDGESPYADLQLLDVDINPETPVAFEDAEITYSFKNNGNQLWESRRLILEIICYDNVGEGMDGILLSLIPGLDWQTRQIDYVDLGFIENLSPGESYSGTFNFRFEAADYTDKVYFTLKTYDPTIPLDGYKEEKETFTSKKVSVDFNHTYTSINCLGTILAGFIYTSFNTEQLEVVSDIIRGETFSQSPVPTKEDFIIPLKQGESEEAMSEFISYLKYHVSMIQLAFFTQGVPIPFVSFVPACITELELRGCGALIGHKLALLLALDLNLLFEFINPSLILWMSGSPVEISVMQNGNVITVDSLGNTIGEIQGTFGHQFDGIRSIIVDPLNNNYLLSFNGFDVGEADFILYNNTQGSKKLLFYNDVYVTPTSYGFIDYNISDVENAQLLIDDNKDEIYDRVITPIVLDKENNEGFIYGKVNVVLQDSSIGLPNVTVDLYDSLGNYMQSVVTNTSGNYVIYPVLPGNYSVLILKPIGYYTNNEVKEVLVFGLDHEVNFELIQADIIPQQRSMGYWKHQVNVHLSGKGNAQETLPDMSNYMGLINQHFNNNLANPITVFEVPQPATQTDSLEVLQQLLTVNRDGTMNDRAKQQLIALMLNVVSFKLHQTTPISEDSATVSQAITYCNQLMTDSDSTNDESAKDIADQINNGILVASGIIPLSTPNITYKGIGEETIQTPNSPREFSLSQNYPNPFNPTCEVAYVLPANCHVTLNIYNILGQKVRVLVNEYQDAGFKSVKWDGKDDQGREVASGVYFYRLQAKDFVQSKKMVLLR